MTGNKIAENDLIERDVRLSESVLWELQRQFYLRNGINFWKERSSFTSANPVVVSACCDLIIEYLKSQLSFWKADEPIYFVEIGAGSGCFAYRFLNEFIPRQLAECDIAHLNVRFVLTDSIPEIISIWRENPLFKRFVEGGNLDFAVFDPARDHRFRTSCFGWNFERGEIINAPVIIANSVFDTIGVDGFRFAKGRAEEVLASVQANQADPMSSLIANELQIEQKFGGIVQMPYYEDREFELLLKQYLAQLHRAVLSIPLRAMEMLTNLRGVTDNRIALLCCSRGFTDIGYAENLEQLQYHDLSFPLNFDALAKYFAIAGGELWIPPRIHDSFVTRCLSFGFVLPKTQSVCIEQTREQYKVSATQLTRATEAIQQTMSQPPGDGSGKSTLASVVDLLETSHFDPSTFLKCIAQSMDSIETEIPMATELDLARLTNALHKVDSNIYTFDRPLPESGCDDSVFALLIRLWQRASAADHQPKGSAVFGFDE